MHSLDKFLHKTIWFHVVHADGAQRRGSCHDNWTGRRASDKSLVQLDFLIGAMAFQTQHTWNDFALPIGLGHRCEHCILHIPVPRPRHKSERRRGLKHWVPYLGTLVCFITRCGSACLRAHIFHWKLRKTALMEQDFKVADAAGLASNRNHRQHYGNYDNTGALQHILKHADCCRSRSGGNNDVNLENI